MAITTVVAAKEIVAEVRSIKAGWIGLVTSRQFWDAWFNLLGPNPFAACSRACRGTPAKRRSWVASQVRLRFESACVGLGKTPNSRTKLISPTPEGVLYTFPLRSAKGESLLQTLERWLGARFHAGARDVGEASSVLLL